jgi:deoxyribodipyrimidine photo-lyase
MNRIEKLADHPRVAIKKTGNFDADGECIVYWMQRSQRAFDNPALNLAIRAANLLHKPVVVFFQLMPHSHHANFRHYRFLIEGLRDVAHGLQQRRVGFVLRCYRGHGLVRFCSEIRPCVVIGDENPMREAERNKEAAVKKLAVPFWTVDADVIVPTRLLAKEHYAARTIRPKIHDLLPKFFSPVPNPRAKVAWKNTLNLSSSIPNDSLLDRFSIDRSVAPVASFIGGAEQARKKLKAFVRSGLRGYATNRNKPELDGTSQLSPYLHFGHIGPHTIALAVKKAKAPSKDRQAFLEEMIVRRELAINFVRFNANYEHFDSCEPWADVTLRKHARDQRKFVYSAKQLENAETHDPLWNAAQKQMVLTGWMHGYMRMYWAKKILEWTASPQEAYDTAVALNDRYELDGRDPNGYAGIAWAIVGKHDRAWGPERTVYGKIRYMSYESTSRKFDSKAYIEKIVAVEKKHR